MSAYKTNNSKTKGPDPVRCKIKATFCATCLSRERKMFSIQGLNLDEFCADIPLSEEEDRVCWECKAIIVKMNEFRHKACKAQALIENMIRRNKCDMFVHSLSELKVVNKSDNIIIGYEVDDNPNSSQIEQIDIDFPKKEIETLDSDNPLSPDADFMNADSLDATDVAESEQVKKNKRKSFIVAEEVSRDIVLNDLNEKHGGSDSDGDVRKAMSRQATRKRKHHDDDEDSDSIENKNIVAQQIKPISDKGKLIKNLAHWQKISNTDNSLPYDTATFTTIEIEAEGYLHPTDDSYLSREDVKEELKKPKEYIYSSSLNASTTSTEKQTVVLSPRPVSHMREIMPLEEILNQSCEGKTILKLHKAEGLLTNTSRRKLCNIIILHLLHDNLNVRVSHETLYRYAQEIKRVFHQENVSTYFVPYVNNQKMKVKTCAKGKLYDCLHNRKRDYRHAEKRLSQFQENASKKTEDLQLREESAKDVQWLKNSTEPWGLVEQKWQATTRIRISELTTTHGTAAEYMREFPVLQQPEGYQLLLMDFRNLYPEKETLLYQNFSILKHKLLNQAEQRSGRDPALKEIVQVLDQLPGGMEDEKLAEVETLLALLTLPLLLGNPLGKVRKSSWRPSKQEACEGFITHISTPTDLLPTVESRRHKFQQHNVTLQPFIVAVGRDYLNIEQYYVVINDSFYTLHTILDAVDVCYKMFHVLNCRYPIECVSTWQFIQKGLYKMQTPWDKNFVSINSLLTDIGIQID